MCYFLYLASPLTLSEVRSMLPPGLTAGLASSSAQQALKTIRPNIQTVVCILAGQCSCDLVRPRQADERADERHLRERYRRTGTTRPAMIAALGRHRRGPHPRAPEEGWPAALVKFVTEHARNAGPSLYLLHFGPGDSAAVPHVEIAPVTSSPGEVRLKPEEWLREMRPVIVA